MSSSGRRRVLRDSPGDAEVLVVGEAARGELPTPSAITTADELVAAGHRRAAAIVAEAESSAAAIVAEAEAVREQARREGAAAGRQAALDELAGHLALIRAAAQEGAAVRDAIAAEALPVMARVVSLATRRLVPPAFEADPELTTEVCRRALEAVSGQEVLRIRVAPTASGAVGASLGEAASYVVPDGAVALGGCVIDLRNGTLDASLDGRLDQLDEALAATFRQEAL